MLTPTGVKKQYFSDIQLTKCFQKYYSVWLPPTTSTSIIVRVWFCYKEKQLGEEKDLHRLTPLRIQDHLEEVEQEQRQKPETGIEAETMEGCCLLSYSSWLAQFVFLYTQDHLPRGGTTHNKWAHTWQTYLSIRPVLLGHFLKSSSQMTLACINLTKTPAKTSNKCQDRSCFPEAETRPHKGKVIYPVSHTMCRWQAGLELESKPLSPNPWR